MTPTGQQAFAHSDDIAVDKFAAAMKAKMAKQRAKGYSGWDDKEDCSTELLQKMLADHITKGDPVDVGNFAMMLFNRGEVAAAPKALAPHEDTKLLDYLQARQATVEILMDGHGLSTPLFRIGGLHGTICADIRGAIGAAIESLKEPTP